MGQRPPRTRKKEDLPEALTPVTIVDPCSALISTVTPCIVHSPRGVTVSTPLKEMTSWALLTAERCAATSTPATLASSSVITSSSSAMRATWPQRFAQGSANPISWPRLPKTCHGGPRALGFQRAKLVLTTLNVFSARVFPFVNLIEANDIREWLRPSDRVVSFVIFQMIYP
jgi:hypothetical protein